jgi:hypothetical protein
VFFFFPRAAALAIPRSLHLRRRREIHLTRTLGEGSWASELDALVRVSATGWPCAAEIWSLAGSEMVERRWGKCGLTGCCGVRTYTSGCTFVLLFTLALDHIRSAPCMSGVSCSRSFFEHNAGGPDDVMGSELRRIARDKVPGTTLSPMNPDSWFPRHPCTPNPYIFIVQPLSMIGF